jgi:hypothetical protein
MRQSGRSGWNRTGAGILRALAIVACLGFGLWGLGSDRDPILRVAQLLVLIGAAWWIGAIPLPGSAEVVVGRVEWRGTSVAALRFDGRPFYLRRFAVGFLFGAGASAVLAVKPEVLFTRPGPPALGTTGPRILWVVQTLIGLGAAIFLWRLGTVRGWTAFTRDGILQRFWRRTVFVGWDAISNSEIKKTQGGPSVEIEVSEPEQIEWVPPLKRRKRGKATRSLSLSPRNLELASGWLHRAVTYYVGNPEARDGIGTEGGLVELHEVADRGD